MLADEGPCRPAAHRLDRRVLRRRDVHGARRARTAGDARRQPRPLDEPGRQGDGVAAARPCIPWTDLAYSLTPNGSTLDYVADAPYRGRIGVESSRSSAASTSRASPLPVLRAGRHRPDAPTSPAGGTRLDAGEPYGAESQAILDEITSTTPRTTSTTRSTPAPMLMWSGFTDDLFPADEAIRYFNRTGPSTRTRIGAVFGDFGHPRGANKDDVTGALNEAEDAWMDYYVKGVGHRAARGRHRRHPTCPETRPPAARTWPTTGRTSPPARSA